MRFCFNKSTRGQVLCSVFFFSDQNKSLSGNIFLVWTKVGTSTMTERFWCLRGCPRSFYKYSPVSLSSSQLWEAGITSVECKTQESRLRKRRWPVRVSTGRRDRPEEGAESWENQVLASGRLTATGLPVWLVLWVELGQRTNSCVEVLTS